MNLRDPFVKSLVLILGVCLLLLVFSFVKNFSIGSYHPKEFNLFSDLFSSPDQQKKIAEKKITKVDSAVALKKDSAKVVEDSLLTYDLKVTDFSSDSSTLEKFCASLYETAHHGKRTRIAYFGDSQVEGDLVTSQLRALLQNKFGGKGVGFVPVTSVVAGFRQTIIHSFSDDWTTYSLITSVPKGHQLGIMGYTFIPKQEKISHVDSSENKKQNYLKYTGSNSFSGLDKFYSAKLFYGKCDSSDYVRVNSGGKILVQNLDGKNNLNELALTSGDAVKQISLNFHCKDEPDIFGASFETDSGVIVDNFSFRGNSGLPMMKIPFDLLRAFDEKLNYDLVVLHYGLNVTNSTDTNLYWYEKGFSKVIEYMKIAFPNADIMIISVSDKSYKHEGEYMTEPSVPYLVNLQRKMAEKSKVAFWNLYENMGGYNSMVSWAEGDTTLANKDYTHFNFRGAAKAGRLLFDDLMMDYNNFVNKKKASL